MSRLFIILSILAFMPHSASASMRGMGIITIEEAIEANEIIVRKGAGIVAANECGTCPQKILKLSKSAVVIESGRTAPVSSLDGKRIHGATVLYDAATNTVNKIILP